jgi:hypothetical protein
MIALCNSFSIRAHFLFTSSISLFEGSLCGTPERVQRES